MRTDSVGHLQQLGGVRLVTLADGIERGVRVLEFRTTAGLEFGVIVDRAMDVGWCRFQGKSVAWHSPTGFVGPWYREPAGDGFLRSFAGGLFTTCGLDHILYAEHDEFDRYGSPVSAGVEYGLHGRVSNTPAILRSYGEAWRPDQTCLLHAEGDIAQAGTLTENLVLHRRVTSELDGKTIVWEDEVENAGHHPTPHMFLYHVNIGAPLLDAACELLAPITDVVLATGVSDDYREEYRNFHEPRRDFRVQVFSHKVAAAGGHCTVALINHAKPEDPWGVALRYESEAFPYFFQWRYLAAGTYVTGFEPATNGLSGRGAARSDGELALLDPGEKRYYRTEMEILAGADDVDRVRAEVIAAVSQSA